MITLLDGSDFEAVTEALKNYGLVEWFIIAFLLWKFVIWLINLIKDSGKTFGLESTSSRKRKEAEEKIKTYALRLEELDKKDEAILNQLNDLSNKFTNLDSKITQLNVDLLTVKTDIANLQNATIEDLYDCINRKCKYYMYVINGIPNDEFDSFKRLTDAYSRCGGNHGLQSRVDWCIDNLPIIEPKTKNN